MNKHFLFSAILYLTAFALHAQIVITSVDMPEPGDTIRKSNTVVLEGIDYLPGGPDQVWLFNQLTVASQQVDTFISVGETPSIYQIFFNNQFIYPDYKATVAQKMATFNAIPGLTLTDSYLFIKNTTEEIREAGYGVTLDGVPLPIQFQQIDTTYRFPLEYGDVDSAHTMFEISVPDMGYLLSSKFRKNTVDAWGTLSTPFGTFQTLRVKTEIEEYDSLYSDSLGFGIPVTRNYKEYKWWANGFPEPMLLITEEGMIVNASYIDSVRSTFLEVPETRSARKCFTVYPNPAIGHVHLTYELADDANVTISVWSLYGQQLKRFVSSRQEKGYYDQVLYLKEQGFPSGVYLVCLTIDNIPYTRRVILE